MNRYRIYMPLRVKFMAVFFILITVPFVISGVFAYEKLSDNSERDASAYTLQLMGQVRLNLERYVKDMDRLTVSPLYDNSVLAILRSHNRPQGAPPYLNSDELLRMNQFLSAFTFDRAEIFNVVILANDGGLFSILETQTNRAWYSAENEWRERVLAQDGGLTVIPPHTPSYYAGPGRQMISFARVLREPGTKRMLGIIKVDMTKEGMESMIAMNNLSNNSHLFITDLQETPIYPFESGDPGVKDAMQEQFPPEQYLHMALDSEDANLRILGIIPYKELRKNADEIIRFLAIVSLIALGCAYVVALAAAGRLVKPIRHLQSKMKLLKQGSLQVQATVTSNDEIGQLAEVFNTMVVDLNQLVKEVYERKLREREAELAALQSQINPHFMYNTLEAINIRALQNRDVVLSSIVRSLAKLLRYTVDQQEKPVILRNELQFVEAYLDIQSFRLGEQLRSEMYVDPSFDYCLVPKLLLQPFVENVIEHAMDGEQPVTVTISASVEGDDLLIRVKDNGKGMDAGTLERLQASLARRRHSHGGEHFGSVVKGVALRNIHQRLQLLYGDGYGIHIQSAPQIGTAFQIKIPYSWEGEGQ
ncbi:sensor histidine kinase [Paenibacillus thalictri]|nr:histidine kinase [Paenibacillus thalictri]